MRIPHTFLIFCFNYNLESTVHTMFTFAAAKTIGKNGFLNDLSGHSEKSISIGKYNLYY